MAFVIVIVRQDNLVSIVQVPMGSEHLMPRVDGTGEFDIGGCEDLHLEMGSAAKKSTNGVHPTADGPQMDGIHLECGEQRGVGCLAGAIGN